MPANKSCWSSWNYLSLAPSGSESKNGSMCLTYWMNNLQPFIPKAQGNIFVTVNPFIEPEGKLGEYEYEHPRLDGELVKSQDEIGEIQNKRGVVYAGAWTNYGFHGEFSLERELARFVHCANHLFLFVLVLRFHQRTGSPRPSSPPPRSATHRPSRSTSTAATQPTAPRTPPPPVLPRSNSPHQSIRGPTSASKTRRRRNIGVGFRLLGLLRVWLGWVCGFTMGAIRPLKFGLARLGKSSRGLPRPFWEASEKRDLLVETDGSAISCFGFSFSFFHSIPKIL